VSVELCTLSELTGRLANRDLHMHTDRTDGRNTLVDMLAAARACGLEEIAITDHVRRDSSWFHDHARAIRREGAPGAVKVRVGIEAKALDDRGTIDATAAMIVDAEFVLGSVHRFPDGRGGFLDYDALSADRMIETELALAMGLIRGRTIHVLAHPGGMCLRRLGAFPADGYRTLMREARDHGVAIEINSSYLEDVPAFLEVCAELDPLVSVASDAHGIEEVGRCRDILRGLGLS